MSPDELHNVLALAEDWRKRTATYSTWDDAAAELELLVRASAPSVVEPANHRCSGCAIRWAADATVAELCGDCWRSVQSNLHVSPPDWITDVIREVAELPDRSSPGDWPEAMLVTSEELRRILAKFAPPAVEAKEPQ